MPAWNPPQRGPYSDVTRPPIRPAQASTRRTGGDGWRSRTRRSWSCLLRRRGTTRRSRRLRLRTPRLRRRIENRWCGRRRDLRLDGSRRCLRRSLAGQRRRRGLRLSSDDSLHLGLLGAQLDGLATQVSDAAVQLSTGCLLLSLGGGQHRQGARLLRGPCSGAVLGECELALRRRQVLASGGQDVGESGRVSLDLSQHGRTAACLGDGVGIGDHGQCLARRAHVGIYGPVPHQLARSRKPGPDELRLPGVGRHRRLRRLRRLLGSISLGLLSSCLLGQAGQLRFHVVVGGLGEVELTGDARLLPLDGVS